MSQFFNGTSANPLAQKFERTCALVNKTGVSSGRGAEVVVRAKSPRGWRSAG